MWFVSGLAVFVELELLTLVFDVKRRKLPQRKRFFWQKFDTKTAERQCSTTALAELTTESSFDRNPDLHVASA